MLTLPFLRVSVSCVSHVPLCTSAPLRRHLLPGQTKRAFKKPLYKMNDSFQYADFCKSSLEQWNNAYSKFDFSDVYPSEKPFDPYLIGLPVRGGGHKIRKELPPLAEGNAVFWQSPNFFHLTPPAIEKHCEALRPLLAQWPSDLPYCPVEVETTDYLLSGNERYHQDGRHVRMEVDFDSLQLTGRPREKMLELLEDKYDIDRNVIKLESRRCPTKTQNKDYLLYLLKVLYYEANRSEKWEEKRLATDQSTDNKNIN